MSKQINYAILGHAFTARQRMARLHEAMKEKINFTDAEYENNATRIRFRPDIKAIAGEVAHDCRETYVEFVRRAVTERTQRILNEQIAAGEAEEALQREAA